MCNTVQEQYQSLTTTEYWHLRTEHTHTDMLLPVIHYYQKI